MVIGLSISLDLEEFGDRTILARPPNSRITRIERGGPAHPAE